MECVSNQEFGRDTRHGSQWCRPAIPTGSHWPGDTKVSEVHVRVAASAPLLAALEVKRPVIGRKPSFLKAKPYIMAGMRRQEGGGGGKGGSGEVRARVEGQDSGSPFILTRPFPEKHHLSCRRACLSPSCRSESSVTVQSTGCRTHL